MDNNLDVKFDKKIKELKEKLPNMVSGANCAELTLTSVLEILGLQDYIYNNLIIPFGGGFGGYKSKKGWMGPCGSVSGGCAATGVILAGKERMSNDLRPMAYYKSAKFATEFEKEFGSVVCSELCGYDLSDPNNFVEYQKNNTWANTCNNFVIWAVDTVRKIMQKELSNWEP
jgi:C_GCAxxG_C_C family probable redox protein